tara:strand:- start:7577 stop:8467 length:891 start_codon:yes stop_codon:yes gene_type:complete
VVQIAPSGYYRHAARARQPELRSIRDRQDELLSIEIQRVWDDNMQCYGVVKVWKQLHRERINVARCTLVDYFGDSASYDFLKTNELDLHILHSAAKSADISDPRLFGSLQLQPNWDKVSSLLRKHLKELRRTHQDEPLKLTWIAPASHGLWGKSARHGEICSAFAELAGARTQKAKGEDRVIFDAKILIPLSDERDMPGIKRAKADCSDAKDLLFGFVESEALAPIEAIVVQGRCAVVFYHLIIPSISQVPIPFGFVTEEAAKIQRISSLINTTLEEYVVGNRQRLLGSINQKKAK